MKFEVELLTKNISITELEKLFLRSEIISITSDSQVKVGDNYPERYSAKYKCTFKDDDFTINTDQFQSRLVRIILNYEYSKSKLNSSKSSGNSFQSLVNF